jgi:putative ABC transport system permease protein
MAGRRHDRWLLIRVAAQNVGRHRLRAIFLGIAVMLGVGVGFASFVAGWALRAGMTTSLSRMGADLVVVPRATLVNITSSLLTVQPTDASLDPGMVKSLAAIPGVARVAPQRIVSAIIDEHSANLIAFDPASDFSILPWLGERQPIPLTIDGVIAGGRVAARVGEALRICDKPFVVRGRLGQTGVGPFDQSYFLSFEALAAIKALSRTSAAQDTGKPVASANAADGLAAPHPVDRLNDAEANACGADLSLNRVSAFLLQLSTGAKVEDVKFGIAQLPGIRIVEGNTVLTSSRQALNSLFIGIIVFTVFQLIAVMIILSLLFSAIVQERYREVGLLRAMGARPNQIMTIILAEAAIITGLGGVAGLAFGTALLLIFARSLGFYFDLLGVPFSWPPLAVLQGSAVMAFVFSAILGFVGAFLPAWRVRNMAPFALIQTQER